MEPRLPSQRAWAARDVPHPHQMLGERAWQRAADLCAGVQGLNACPDCPSSSLLVQPALLTDWLRQREPAAVAGPSVHARTATSAANS
jgi:hypothetical protein